MEGCSLINEILTVETEKVEWPANAEPKFMKKKTSKAIRSAYDSKMKRYIYNDTSTMAPGEPIRLELSEAFFHFCYHPERKEHIKIETLAGQETGTKYVVIVSNCHWIWERNITVIALLTYATQRAQVQAIT